MYKAILAILVALLAVMPAFAGEWDLVGDATTPANPNGPWSHGWTNNFDAGWSMTLMDLNHFTDGDTVMRWQTAASFDGTGFAECPLQLLTTSDPNMPYGFFELNKFYCHGGMTQDPEVPEAALHPTHNVMRWTAPEAGLYKVSAELTGVEDFGTPAGVNCQVLVDGLSMYSQGFAYEDGSLAVELTFDLAAGSNLDLAIGPGESESAQWTCVSEHIETVVPEPSSIVALLCGMGGFVGLLRRRA